MEINLTDLECERLSETVFNCVAEQPATPLWFYPVVLACFAMALVILVLTAMILFGKRGHPQQNRRLEDQQPVHVKLDHRKVE